jgi:exodeoxyribonuclease V alpha subunit
VIQTRNDYRLPWRRETAAGVEEGAGVFNGDVGFIVAVDPEDHTLTVRFDEDREVTYESGDLEDLEQAYCLSVHKSQGSEYRAVIFAAMNAAPSLMVRGVLYTAITRARELLVMVGDDAAVRNMTANDRQQRRYSGLKWRLRNGA